MCVCVCVCVGVGVGEGAAKVQIIRACAQFEQKHPWLLTDSLNTIEYIDV